MQEQVNRGGIPAATLRNPSAKGVVMVVDDDQCSREIVERMLRPRGYDVRSYPDGRMAMAAAGMSPPDVILLDINMPGFNGYEVCEQLKRHDRLCHIPVIFLSAFNSLDDRLKGFRSGGSDYVSKPFNSAEVQARVDAHLSAHRVQQLADKANARLQDLVKSQVGKIFSAEIATTFAIAKLAEARDDETGSHLRRVQQFCGLLAGGLSKLAKYETQINAAWVNNIFHASPLHDIGKVAIPDQILLKPGPLTSEEFTIMKTHAAVGASTLRAVHEMYPENQFTEMGIKLAQSHHEKWNGGGYPDGLAGETIPLCARILAVADCYDALRSKRCYKQPVPHTVTCAIIHKDSGAHFDPEVVAVFTEVAGEFDRAWIKGNL